MTKEELKANIDRLFDEIEELDTLLNKKRAELRALLNAYSDMLKDL